MPTARYWRVSIAKTPAMLYLELAEVAFLDAAGSDLSVGGVPFASSEHSASYNAAKAFDKSTATLWSTVVNGLPGIIGYDHGAPVTAEGLRVSFTSQYTNSGPAGLGGLKVEYSTDNVTWSDPLHVKYLSGEIGANATVDTEFYTLADLQTQPVGGELFAEAATITGSASVFLSDGVHPFRDFENSGAGRIAGTVKEDGSPDIPVKRRVRLHREQDGLLIREVWSHPTTGAYSFDHIDTTKRYTVITYDYEHDYRAVIADNITPEAMP